MIIRSLLGVVIAAAVVVRAELTRYERHPSGGYYREYKYTESSSPLKSSPSSRSKPPSLHRYESSKPPPRTPTPGPGREYAISIPMPIPIVVPVPASSLADVVSSHKPWEEKSNKDVVPPHKPSIKMHSMRDGVPVYHSEVVLEPVKPAKKMFTLKKYKKPSTEKDEKPDEDDDDKKDPDDEMTTEKYEPKGKSNKGGSYDRSYEKSYEKRYEKSEHYGSGSYEKPYAKGRDYDAGERKEYHKDVDKEDREREDRDRDRDRTRDDDKDDDKPAGYKDTYKEYEKYNKPFERGYDREVGEKYNHKPVERVYDREVGEKRKSGNYYDKYYGSSEKVTRQEKEIKTLPRTPTKHTTMPRWSHLNKQVDSIQDILATAKRKKSRHGD